MYKSHGKDYLENNFTSDELDLIMRPPQGSNSIKTSIISKCLEKDMSLELPISPPLTPKLSPKKKYEVEERVETALDLKIRTKSFFEQEDNGSHFKCEMCQLSFISKESFLNHFDHMHKLSNLKTNKLTIMETNDQFENSGFKCVQCNKILMHKQSFVSHMRVIHGDYYGENKWNGSKVVEMVLGDSEFVTKNDVSEDNIFVEKKIKILMKQMNLKQKD